MVLIIKNNILSILSVSFQINLNPAAAVPAITTYLGTSLIYFLSFSRRYLDVLLT